MALTEQKEVLSGRPPDVGPRSGEASVEPDHWGTNRTSILNFTRIKTPLRGGVLIARGKMSRQANGTPGY